METTKQSYSDTFTIAWRCLLLSCRNPETFLTSILLPALMMLLFVSLFGSLIRVDGTSYTAYIVPGVLIQCAAQGSSTTAIMVNQDITSGILSRFSTLPIRQGALLYGHVLEACARNLVTSAVVLVIALLLGFRPALTLTGLGITFLLLSGMILAGRRCRDPVKERPGRQLSLLPGHRPALPELRLCTHRASAAAAADVCPLSAHDTCHRRHARRPVGQPCGRRDSRCRPSVVRPSDGCLLRRLCTFP